MSRPPGDPGESGLEWLSRFEHERGRPLRVLHLSNIANNAYNNAKIQRRRGIDADVSCHDYFHIMGCPEWEDAEFEGDVVDEFFPDWWNVDLHGYERPDWFSQGNWRTCQRYLLARRRRRALAALYRRRLNLERWLWCRSTPLARALGYRRGLAYQLRFAWSMLRGIARKSRDLVRAIDVLRQGKGWRRAAYTVFPTRLTRLFPERVNDESEEALRYRRRFPGRQPFGHRDLRGYRIQARHWAPVFEEYDLVQGYALDPILPLLCGSKAWTAYEHGTLREIPFQETAVGRTCALAYAEAPIVFVTNSDVLPSVERLGLDSKRMVYLPHAVDTDKLFAFADEYASLRPPSGSRIRIYAPSRQDWVDGDVSWSKGNDRFLRAAAELAPRYDFQLTLGEWGRDLEASRALARELELIHRIDWVPPLRKRELWSRYLSSHAVVDQFTLTAIGGVAFEAMALGCRVITALDASETERFFGRSPPLLGAREVDEIAATLESVLRDPDDAAGVGAASRAWVVERHSSDRIVELQAAAYRTLLDRA